MSEEFEQATPAQKLSISNYFLSSSPTGEIHDVLIDVAKLVADPSVLSDEAIKKMMKQYNEDQFQTAVTPAGGNLVVSAYGAVADDEYLDPSTGKVLKFDHRNHKFTDETSKTQELSSEVEAYRAAIAKSMDAYLTKQFKKGKATVTVYGADDGNITICLSSRNVNLNAFWTGGWRSIFTLNIKTKGTTEMKCNTKVNVHYFEDGNVQLHGAIENSHSVNVADDAATGEAVAKAVTAYESDYQNSMEEFYVDMHRYTFKKMRRFLPITKQPMNWNTFAHGVMAGDKK